MEFLLWSVIASFIICIPMDFSKKRRWIRNWIIRFTSVAAGLYVFAWAVLPQMIGPLGGWILALAIFMGLLIRFVALICFYDPDGFGFVTREQSREMCPYIYRVLIVLASTVFLFGIISFAGCSMFHARGYSAFVARDMQERDWKEDMSPVDQTHIRQVSLETAQWRANKALGQGDGALGSRYKVGSMHIQKVGDELVWVGALEFQGFKAWSKFRTTPGYVMVSAENPHEEAKLVTGYELKYMPSAFFGKDIRRHLYKNGYQFTGTTDYTLEVDDEGKPYWVVSLYKPTISYWGNEVLGVAVVDPQTGEISRYSVGLLHDEAPAWVDRVIPEWIACKRLTDYGSLNIGWWNSVWAKFRVVAPTAINGKHELWLTWGDDGRAYWFTGLTSVKDTDQALVGFVMMDSRSGHTRIYNASGDDESGIIAAVNASVSNFNGWVATEPILYNIYGELTWAVPVISDAGIFQRLAVVHLTSQQVALGANKTEALAAYRRILSEQGNATSPTSQSATRTVEGVVDRFACPVESGNTNCYLALVEDATGRVFTGGTTISYELPITRLGDKVKIEFIETGEKLVAMEGFDLLGFGEGAHQEGTQEQHE